MFQVVLVEPEIPQNTGNVGRLCLAVNATLHLIEPLGFSLDDRHLKRAGLDYWKAVDLRVWPSLDSLRASAPGEARYFYFSTKAQRDYWSAEFRAGDYLVFGRETRGLPVELLQANETQAFRIPTENVRSLNLSTSVGIVVYEAYRQARLSRG